MIEAGQAPNMVSSRDIKTLSHLIDLHLSDLREVGQTTGRSKMAVLESLKRDLGYLKIKNLDRPTLIQYGKKRAKERAGKLLEAILQHQHAEQEYGRASRDFMEIRTEPKTEDQDADDARQEGSL